MRFPAAGTLSACLALSAFHFWTAKAAHEAGGGVPLPLPPDRHLRRLRPCLRLWHRRHPLGLRRRYVTPAQPDHRAGRQRTAHAHCVSRRHQPERQRRLRGVPRQAWRSGVAAGQAMERMRDLLAQAKLPVGLNEIRQLQNEFHQIHLALLTAHRQQQIALLAVQDRLTAFEAERREFDGLLRTITVRGESLMSKSRDKAAVEVSAARQRSTDLTFCFRRPWARVFPWYKVSTS